MELIKGKWYGNLGTFNSIAKFDSYFEKDTKKFGHYEAVHEGVKYSKSKNLSWYTINLNTYELDNESLIKLLPDNHTDLQQIKFEPIWII